MGPQSSGEGATQRAEGGRLVSVDVLRGLAALAVVIFHAADYQPYLFATNWGGRVAGFFAYWGLLGVYLFFVISGFCIHLRWAQHKASGLETRIDLKRFWKRRFWRLYPAYAATMVLYLLGARLFDSLVFDGRVLADIGVHLVMLHNVMPETTFSLNGVYWTLAVEEQLYLAYFLLLRVRLRWGWTLTLLLTLGTRVAWLALGMLLHRRWGLDITVTESAAALWFCWALGALGVESYLGLVRLPRWCTSGVCGFALLAFALVLGTVQAHGAPTGWAHHARTLVLQPLYSFSFFVIMNWTVRLEARFLTRGGLVRLFARLGMFSYSLYLTHEIVLTQVGGALARHYGWSTMTRTTVGVLVFTPLAVLFARVCFEIFERPFLFRAHPPTTRPATAIAGA